MLTFVDPQKKVSRGELESVKSPDSGPFPQCNSLMTQIAKIGDIGFSHLLLADSFVDHPNLVLTNVDP